MKMFKFAVIKYDSDVILVNKWQLPEGEDATAEITEDLRTRVTYSGYTGHVYAVNNGTLADFKELEPGHGAYVRPGQILEIRSNAQADGLRANLVVIEYDVKGQRLTASNLRVGESGLLTLRKDTSRILMTLRFAGKGSISFERLAVYDAGTAKPDQQPGLATLATPSTRMQMSLEELRRVADHVTEESIKLSAAMKSGIRNSALQQQSCGHNSTVATTSEQRESVIRELLLSMSSSIPLSNGSRHYGKINLNIGIITDEFMLNYYKDTFRQVVYLSPENYVNEFSRKSFDLVIYVTCWKGVYDEEWKGIQYREKPSKALAEILDECKARKIPTVFQSIEDPVNYDRFIEIARMFDYVFTSDTGSVDAYRRDLGHDRVFYGEYGANPQLNNPIGVFRFDIEKAFFAGSYPERYPERCADMNVLFDSIIQDGRVPVIADRNYREEGFDFPEKIKPYTIGALPHIQLQSVHKLFHYNLNFNSVKNSPTMCAMRVYELQAQGKFLISNYATSVFNKFPHVRISASEGGNLGLFSKLSKLEELRFAMRGIDEIMTERTSFAVTGNMLDRIGISGLSERIRRCLVVIVGDLELGIKVVAAQDMNSKDVDVVAYEDFVRDYSAGDSKAVGSNYGYVAVMLPKIAYEEDYLRSRVNVFKYVDVDFVTQKSIVTEEGEIVGTAHEYVDEPGDFGLTVVATDAPYLKTWLLTQGKSSPGRGYATDPTHVGFVDVVRRKELAFRSRLAVSEQDTPILSVVVPVYNNGVYLESKCISSLLRQEAWPMMEVILVDDGSDANTRGICSRLERMYPNVRTWFFGDSGSGSASRPRNKGIELAAGSLITFLDPDNEISVGGYDHLLATYKALSDKGEKVQLVCGYQVKVSSSPVITGRHAQGKVKIVDDAKATFFEMGKFPVFSTQAAVMETDLLRKNRLEFVTNAVGQDTLFGWEVVLRSGKCAFTDGAFLLYYAERADSITNSLDSRYFDKCMILERKQVSFLSDVGLLDTYKEHHLDQFVRGWYMKKLELVSHSQKERSHQVLSEILRLYGRDIADFM